MFGESEKRMVIKTRIFFFCGWVNDYSSTHCQRQKVICGRHCLKQRYFGRKSIVHCICYVNLFVNLVRVVGEILGKKPINKPRCISLSSTTHQGSGTWKV